MRLIGLFAMCLWLGACATPPLFPPEIMKDVESDILVLKTWKEQTSVLPGDHFVSHKVELGGQITQVIRKPDGVVILAEEYPNNKYLGYGPTSVRRKGSFEFAIVLHDSPDANMLEAGNQLAVVGATETSSSEMIDGKRRVLPHLRAQCLHIWKTDGFETDIVPWEGSMGYYPLEKQTFCRKEGTVGTLSTGDGQGNETKGSTGS